MRQRETQDTKPYCINGKGEITGFYYNSNRSHGFACSAEGKIESFDAPHADGGTLALPEPSPSAKGQGEGARGMKLRV